MWFLWAETPSRSKVIKTSIVAVGAWSCSVLLVCFCFLEVEAADGGAGDEKADSRT